MDLIKYIRLELLNKGADEVLVSEDNGINNQIKFVNNRVVSITAWNQKGISIFVSKDQKIVSTALKSFNKKDADEVIKQILTLLKAVNPNENYNGIANGPFNYKKIEDIYDRKIETLDGADIVEETINTALAEGAKRCSGVLEFGTGSNQLTGSNDINSESKGSNIYLSIRSFTDKDASGAGTVSSRILSKFDTKSCIRKTAEFATLAKNPQHINPGKYKVIFDPLPLAALFNPLMEAASAFSVENGMSFFKDKLNSKVLNQKLTIYDDATLANGPASRMYDDEGMPSQKTTIINSGVLKNFLHNTSTAARFNTVSTANAGLISPDPSNIVIAPGKDKDVLHDGLYITNLWYTRFQNYSTGDFSTIPRDGIFLVKDGKIVKSVKDIRISDNMLKMFSNIKAIGASQEQIQSWEAEIPCLTPAMAIEDVNITRSKE